jgi:hypothetical protein
MNAFQLYLLSLFLLIVAYTLSYEPVGRMQVELFELMKNQPKFVDHYEYPSVDSQGQVQIVPIVSVDGSLNNQNATGWKGHWRDTYMNSGLRSDTSFDGTSYMNYSKDNPLLYDGVRVIS